MAILAFISSVGLTSCSKEDPANAVDFDSFSLAQGTIEGIAFATYDVSSDAPKDQYAPSGTVIFLTVSFNELGINNAFNGETRQLQATVGSGGKFSFTGIPLNRYNATDVIISGQPFVKGYITDGVNDIGEPVLITKSRVFTAPALPVSIEPGSKEFVTISYSAGELFQ